MGQRTKELLAVAARTADGVGPAVCGMAQYEKFIFMLDVDAHAGTTPTLDAKVQHSIDGGANWVDLAAFTQVTTTDGAQFKFEAEVEAATAEVIGDCMRVSWDGGGTGFSYTFGVKVNCQDSD